MDEKLPPPSPRILCLIPAYNEEESVVKVIDDLRHHVPQADLLVIDDGSSDATSLLAKRAGAKVCRLSYNLGIGGAVQTGLKYAWINGYDIAIQVDGDNQHPAEEIPKLIAALQADDNLDMVIGSRFIGRSDFQSTVPRRLGISIFARILSMMCAQRLTDTTSGFRATRGEAIEFLARYYPRDYPEVEALVLLHRARYSFAEIPTRMRQRLGGKSSIRLRHGAYYMIKVTLAVAIELLKRPKARKGNRKSFTDLAMD